MRRSATLHLKPRIVLLLSGCLSVVVGATLATGADPGRAAAKRVAPSRRATAVVMAVPSGGDVSYGVVRVRIARGARLLLPAGLGREQTIFSSRIGGLAVRARSAQWRALRPTTRVYVVVSTVAGADLSVRDVALFVVRRKTPGGPRSAQVTVTIANARAQVGSFWVHGVDRRGYATIFNARNILSTALSNWSRYVHALQVANAIKAAMHPRVLPARGAAAAPAATRRRTAAWTGGQQPDARVRTLYRLIVGALHDPTAYGALKRSPLVPDFIATELGNPPLAARWRAVVAHVPVTVPDQYAALAQEEKRFTRVAAPRLTHAVVAIGDGINSRGQWDLDDVLLPLSKGGTLIIDVPPGPAGGSVEVQRPDLSLMGTCSSHCLYPLTATAAGTPTVPYVLLTETPRDDSVFSQGTGCSTAWNGPTCKVDLTVSNQTVSISFAPAARLTVSVQSSDSMHPLVSIGPLGTLCFASCDENFAIGSTITVTAVFGSGDNLLPWSGCDHTSGNSCTVTMSQAKSVTANFGPGYELAVALQTNAPGQVGTVTSGPAGIDCGAACSASFGSGSMVTLTAANGPQAVFVSWSGCDQILSNSCTVTMSQAKNVTATFGPGYDLAVTLQTNTPGHVGTVTSSPAGIDCGTACSATFASDSMVTLTAADAPQAIFVSWSGCDQVASGNTCRVTMNQAKNVVANYAW